MNAYLLVHVRPGPRGTIGLTPVVFPDLAVGPAPPDRARNRLRRSAAERLASLDAIDRLWFIERPKGSLHRVPVDVGKGDNALPITLGIVVVRTAARGRDVAVAYAPAVPNLEVKDRDGDVERLLKKAAARFTRRMSSWSSAPVLAADEPDDTYLEVVEVELPGLELEEHDDPAGILAEAGVELTRGEFGRLDRRDALVERVLETLAAEGRSSVLLVGRADVGKTALIHEAARRLRAGEAPSALIGRRMWRVSANELIAGAKYTGMWQERAQRLIAEARESRAIVVMGDPVGIVDAGRWSESANNLSRFLRPYIESGEVTLVCECTIEQFSAVHAKEPSFIDAFHRVDVLEPSLHETREIAEDVASRLGESASIVIADTAIDAAVELTRRFEPYRSFPGKTIRLLEDSVRERPAGVEEVTREQVTETFARRTGMPLGLLSDAHQIRPTEVEEHFESRVLGQPEATQAMVDTVLVAKASLNDASKPLGSFFFVGPTGVGKTELAKALAEYLFGSRDRLVRLDMAEYASGDSVQRLIGTAWGSREGELTRRVREQPFCVLLLDEIEKAHWAVFDALLGVLDEGRLTDASGRTADFRNAILIMTSNLGAERARSSGFGFVQGDDGGKTRAYVEEAEKFFRPEFFNRINRIVVFHTLSGQTVRRIAQRELARLLERDGIVRRGLKVEVDDRVVERLASQGFHPRYGARPLQREIERTVIQPLARILVARPLDASEFVRIRLDGDAVTVERERIAEQADPDRRRVRRAEAAELSLGRLEAEAAGFVTDLASDEANGSADEVRSMVSELVANTHAPSFWEDGTRARGVLRSLYQLEQLVGGFDALRERADGLVQFARRVRETHNQARAGEIPAAIEEMRDRLLVLRLELAAAAAGATGDTAQLRVIPIGSADAWAERLLRMYEQWSERTGREYERVGGQTLAIQGPATYGLLRGESGIHKHVRPDGREELARVTLDGDENMGESPIARVYEEGKRRLVRDPRTAARATHVGAVLDEGHIDLFLIAALREATGTTSRE